MDLKILRIQSGACAFILMFLPTFFIASVSLAKFMYPIEEIIFLMKISIFVVFPFIDTLVIALVRSWKKLRKETEHSRSTRMKENIQERGSLTITDKIFLINHYIFLGLFIIVITIFRDTLIKPTILNIPEQYTAGSSISFNTQMKSLISYLILIQAFFSGLILTEITEKRRNGLIHTLFSVLISIIVFFV